MTTSKTRPLCSFRFGTEGGYGATLSLFCDLIETTPEDAVVVAPEVCLTGFDYERFDEAAAFAPVALEALLPLSGNRIIVLTLIERRPSGVFNVAKVLHGGRVVHEQMKSRLFRLGEEHRYFSEGEGDAIAVFEVDGVRMGVLICFELRFKELWQRLEGADVIAVPAQWGKLRASHFATLTEALAVMNQCYVVFSDSSDAQMTGLSGVVTPFGEVRRNGNAPCLNVPYEENEVQKMRRYLDVGINAQ